MKTNIINSLLFLLLLSACGESTETTNADSGNTSAKTNSSDSLIEQWKNEIAGRILQYYYSDSYYAEKIQIAICEQGFGSYYKYNSGSEMSFNFNWHIENTEAGGPILYIDGETEHYSYNLIMEDGIIYLNKNKYLRMEEGANCN